MVSRRESSLVKNKKMSPKVYALRRHVINLIHEAKKIKRTLPRIEVRVVDNHEWILGVAAMGYNIIWITEDFVASREVVFHEILHAVYNMEHVDGCKLMGPASYGPVSDEECNRLFKQYTDKFN